MRIDTLFDSVFVLKWGFFKELGMIEHNLLLQSVSARHNERNSIKGAITTKLDPRSLGMPFTCDMEKNMNPLRFIHKRLLPLLNPRMRRKVNPEEEPKIVLYLTNYCNDRCFSCSTLCDKPHSNHFNKHNYNMEPLEAKTFFKNLGDYGLELPVRFAGGEPTLNPHISKLAEIVKNKGRFVDIITNAAKITEIDPYLFNWIYLDEHAANGDAIKKAIKYFKKQGYNNWTSTYNVLHRDIAFMRKNNISYGVRCPLWMRGITVYNGIVYPCCVFPPLIGWDEDGAQIDSALIRAGYTVKNPNISTLLTDWRSHLPDIMYRKCTLSCWRGAPQNRIKWYKTNYVTI